MYILDKFQPSITNINVPTFVLVSILLGFLKLHLPDKIVKQIVQTQCQPCSCTNTTTTTTTRGLLHSETELKLQKYKPLKFTGYRNPGHSCSVSAPS